MSEWFATPSVLLALPAVVACDWIVRHTARALVRRQLRAFGSRVGSGLSATRRARWLADRCFSLGLAFAVIALAQPRWGYAVRQVEQRGLDVLICLDVSRSMLASDLEPSRLGAAQKSIRRLATRNRGDRMGLVVFAGEARRNVPLTQDMVSFADLVDLADPFSVGTGGTDLGAALECANEVFEESTGDFEVVLLLTDGEDLGGRGVAVAETLAERNIVVHCVGFGSPRGAKIAVGERGRQRFLRDASGAEVVSAMDPESLRAIATATGGATALYSTTSGDADPLVALYEREIVPRARKSLDAREHRERRDRFQWFVAAAMACWLAEIVIARARGTDRDSRTRHQGGAVR